jgi:hypothetical protein
MTKRAILLMCFGLVSLTSSAQYIENYKPEPITTIVKCGVGYGYDYGVLGARLTITPIPKFGGFIAVGYNLLKAGVNGGLTYKFLPDRKVCPVAHVMYGNNAIIKVEGTTRYDKAYYGLTAGGGIELNMRKSNNYWSFELLYSAWSSQFERDWDDLKNNPNIIVETEPFPLSISVGYHFNI